MPIIVEIPMVIAVLYLIFFTQSSHLKLSWFCNFFKEIFKFYLTTFLAYSIIYHIKLGKEPLDVLY